MMDEKVEGVIEQEIADDFMEEKFISMSTNDAIALNRNSINYAEDVEGTWLKKERRAEN